MSYDLTVYVPEALTGLELREFIAAQNSLDVDAFDDELAWMTVTRGAQRNSCFSVDGPFRVEPEDVPQVVTAAVLGVAHLYTVTVEGSAEADVPHAVRFARRLAQSLGGAALDQQTGEAWARGASRKVARPRRDRRINVVHVDWYARSADVDQDFGHFYTSLCRRLVPEALPRRFGEFEPLQGRLEDGGDEGFCRFWRDATTTVFFTATAPCITGSLSAGANARFPTPIWHTGITIHHEALQDTRWREAFQRFFVSIGEHLQAFYASAEVTRGNIWNGRSLWSDARTEWPLSPARREGWMGLPPYPVWWAWYGRPYRKLIGSQLRHGRVIDHGRGVLHELADAPLDRDQLTDLVTVRRGLRRRTEWIPAELLARMRPAGGRVQPIPLDAAETIPSDLL